MRTEIYDFWGVKIRQLNYSFTKEDETILFQMKRSESLDYFVVLHDPHFFFNTYLIQTIPKAFFQLKRGKNFIGTYLIETVRTLKINNIFFFISAFKAVEYERLNRLDYRCEAKDYSFTACVKVLTTSFTPSRLTNKNSLLEQCQ